MKQVTTKKIKEFERAFHQGENVFYYDISIEKSVMYRWIKITDVKKIKECVLHHIDMRIM